MAWKTLTTVSYIQVWNAGFGPAMKEYQNGFDLHKRIAHTPSLPHCSLSQGFSWIFTYAVCNGMLHPPPMHCINEDKALWIKRVKGFAPITDFTKARLNSLSPHTYVCIVSAQKCGSPRSESADSNGPLHSRLWGNTHLQILRVSNGASWCLLCHELLVNIIYLAEWTNAQTNEPHHFSLCSLWHTSLSSLLSAFPVVKASGENWQNSFHKTHETH